MHDADEFILVDCGIFGQLFANPSQSAFQVVPLTSKLTLHFLIKSHLGDLQKTAFLKFVKVSEFPIFVSISL